jgi:hypothetical protein
VSTLVEIVEGCASRLKSIVALDENVLTVVRRPADYPAAIIVPPTIPDYGDDLAGGGGEFVLPVLLLVGVTEAENQQTLVPYLDWSGDSSIHVAFQTQRDLGLGDVDARVGAVVDPGLRELPDGSVAYGVTVNIHVIAS